MSATQIKVLGDRLGRSKVATKADRKVLGKLIADYAAPMEFVQDRIRNQLGTPSVARTKTEKTTIEKLRRDRTRLNKMQDLAGVRIVAVMTLEEQDAIVAQLVEIFPKAEIDDLRNSPAKPYRAVHVIPTIDECPIEIQVRTHLQHAWADVFERLADATDRRIRYGDVPRDPRARVIFDALLEASPAIGRFENAREVMMRDIAKLDRRRAKLIVAGPPAPVGHPQRKARDLLLRRLNRERLRLRGRVAQSETAWDQYREGLHGTADAIRAGRFRFERGIVE